MAAGSVNFSGSWTTLYNDFVSAVGQPVMTTIALGGLAMVVVGIITWVIKKRRGGGGDNKGLLWTIGAGALLASPAIVIPLILKLVDLAVNFVIKVWP